MLPKRIALPVETDRTINRYLGDRTGKQHTDEILAGRKDEDEGSEST
jgi:hypothetical protein